MGEKRGIGLTETIGAFLLLAFAGAIVLKMSLAPPPQATRRPRLHERRRGAGQRVSEGFDQAAPAGPAARPATAPRPPTARRPATIERHAGVAHAPILTEEFEPATSRESGVLSSTRLVLGVTGLGIATAAGMILIARAIVLLLERLVRL